LCYVLILLIEHSFIYHSIPPSAQQK